MDMHLEGYVKVEKLKQLQGLEEDEHFAILK